MAIYTTWNQTKLSIGDTISVHQKLIETDADGNTKERIQIFEGTLIAIKGKQENKTITVRKTGANYIGVERIWPLASPWIKEIAVKNPGSVKRAKIYYVREQSRKQLRKLILKKSQ